jgi:hypothetical protein
MPISLSRGERSRLHRQRVARLDQRRQRQQQQLAAQRRRIPGVEQMQPVLAQIEAAQQRLRESAEALRRLLGIAPLAKAFAEFQRQGGVTATDWLAWLAGESGASLSHASKQHLRIVSVCCGPLLPRQPPLQDEMFADLDDEPDFDLLD